MGCTVAELPERIGWQEWIDWLAYWEIEPWGEARADERAAAGICYQLAPYLPKEMDLPQLAYPYFESSVPTREEIEEMQRAVREHTERWAEWERGRKKGR